MPVASSADTTAKKPTSNANSEPNGGARQLRLPFGETRFRVELPASYWSWRDPDGTTRRRMHHAFCYDRGWSWFTTTAIDLRTDGVEDEG